MNLDAYKLKWIAIVGMVLSHIVYVGAWREVMPLWLYFALGALGGLTFPILSYFIADGYRHTSSLKRYISRLLIFGLVALPFHFLVISMPFFNIMFTIALSLMVLRLYDKIKIRALFWVLYILIIVPISTMFFEWYFIGVTMVLLSYIIRNKTARCIVPPVFMGVCLIMMALLALPFVGDYAPEASGVFRNANMFFSRDALMGLIPAGLVCMSVAVLLKNYNGQRGKKSKWLFYVIYPLHFAVIAAIAIATGAISLAF